MLLRLAAARFRLPRKVQGAEACAARLQCAPMIDHLSPREEEDLRRAEAAGAAWPALLRAHFLDGSRLRLGWDASRGESDLGGPSVRGALEEAARFCAAHGLHFLFFEGEKPGDEPLGERRWFMAVG
jgi:hypothetical protein